MNVKDEFPTCGSVTSDSEPEMPKPQMKLKEDPDWDMLEKKPRVRRSVRTDPVTGAMNVKDEFPSCGSETSDSEPEMPKPKRKIKEDPDWDVPEKKTRVRRTVKTDPDGEKPKRARKVKTEQNGETEPKKVPKPKAERKPRAPRKAKAASDVKPKVGRGKVAKVEEDGDVKLELKRKKEESDDVPVKKQKVVASTSKHDDDFEGARGIGHSGLEASIVSRNMNCNLSKAQTLIQMLNEGATIPFLIRYRKNVVGDWSPTDMRMFKEMYQNAKEVITRAAFVKKKISSSGHLNEHMIRAIDSAWTLAELDDIYEPYKPAKTKSKLAILRDLGLDAVADQILNKQFVDIRNFVNFNNEHTKTLEDVKVLLATSITETILRRMKDVERLWREDNWTMHSVKIVKGKVEDDKENFKKYYDFRRPARFVRADEVLAMNRGAKKKILKVTLTPKDHLKDETRRAISGIFGLNWLPQNDIGDVLNRAVTAAQDKLMTKISKKIRLDNTRSAEVTAIEVFSANLKRLLLTPPFRSDHEFHVLGIDPGKRNGCKTVIVNSKSLKAEENAIIHLFTFKGPREYPYDFEWAVMEMLRKWGVEIIVVGNGVGCQDVENVVNNIIRLPEFSRIRYTVIPEQGVSVYSVSEEAQEEYPDFKPEVVSSLSLVKRFFNPLHEYVKVDPKHLGIGMYQHDIDEKKLTEALQETVSEIVSVVGVDLNAASVPLLKSVAGLTESRAKAIIAHRTENGPFKNRKEIRAIKGIGPKTFQQCAGFVRIIPPLNVVNGSEYNLLDQTIVHPEHYSATHKLLGLMGLSLNDIGSLEFIEQVKSFSMRENVVQVSEKLGVDIDTTKLLFHALAMSLNQDIRTLADPPDFKTRMCSIDQLRQGMTVSGRVENVTTFGAFVDIGVGVSGLLYFNQHNKPDVGLGDRIEVQIDKLEVNRERIGLKLQRKIADLFPMNKLI